MRTSGKQDNPDFVRFKNTKDGAERKIGIDELTEFGIDEIVRYVIFRGQVDWSSDTASSLDDKQEPVFVQDTLALKVLVSGIATLYFCEKRVVKRFFYAKEGAPIQQLVHKRYVEPLGVIRLNNQYRKQLNTDFADGGIDILRIDKLRYERKSLEQLFIDYNVNRGDVPVQLEDRPTIESFNLSLRPGVQQTSIELTNALGSTTSLFDVNWETKTIFSIGLEAEYVIPFYGEKFSILVEPTYQSYEATSRDILDRENSIDYRSIELGVGARHYMYLGNNSKVFFNAMGLFDFPLESKNEVTTPGLRQLVYQKSITFAAGAGYKFANKVSLEVRYRFNKRIFELYENLESKYTAFAVIFGYTI